MMHFGIPAYRLPREELMKEIARIEAMGVRIVLNHKVNDLLAEKAAGRSTRCSSAIGAHVCEARRHPGMRRRQDPRRGELPARRRAPASAPRLGRRVVIYGGGNTAMDAARTARRLGAEEALIVYRRDRAHMPAHAFEADEAFDEGVKIKWLSTHQGDRRTDR